MYYKCSLLHAYFIIVNETCFFVLEINGFDYNDNRLKLMVYILSYEYKLKM